MIQKILVFIAVAFAVLFLIRKFFGKKKNNCDKNCGG